jgi:hypothetical protein
LRSKVQKLCYLQKRGGKLLRINWVIIIFSCREKYWWKKKSGVQVDWESGIAYQYLLEKPFHSH